MKLSPAPRINTQRISSSRSARAVASINPSIICGVNALSAAGRLSVMVAIPWAVSLSTCWSDIGSPPEISRVRGGGRTLYRVGPTRPGRTRDFSQGTHLQNKIRALREQEAAFFLFCTLVLQIGERIFHVRGRAPHRRDFARHGRPQGDFDDSNRDGSRWACHRLLARAVAQGGLLGHLARSGHRARRLRAVRIKWLAVTPAKWSTLSQLGAHFADNAQRYVAQFIVWLAIFSVALTALGHKARDFIPAFAFLYLFSVAIFALGQWDQASRYNLEPPLVALVLGLVISNLIGLPRFFDAGFRVE